MANWTALDDPGQRAECSNTAECRFDSYPICPTLDVDDPEATWPVSTPMELGIAARVAASWTLDAAGAARPKRGIAPQTLASRWIERRRRRAPL